MLPKLVILSNVDHETTVWQYALQHKGEMGLYLETTSQVNFSL